MRRMPRVSATGSSRASGDARSAAHPNPIVAMTTRVQPIAPEKLLRAYPIADLVQGWFFRLEEIAPRGTGPKAPMSTGARWGVRGPTRTSCSVAVPMMRARRAGGRPDEAGPAQVPARRGSSREQGR
jgi:hypothetical protein